MLPSQGLQIEYQTLVVVNENVSMTETLVNFCESETGLSLEKDYGCS